MTSNLRVYLTRAEQEKLQHICDRCHLNKSRIIKRAIMDYRIDEPEQKEQTITIIDDEPPTKKGDILDTMVKEALKTAGREKA